MMTLDEMKTFVRAHFEDFVNRKDLDAIDRNFAPTFIDHDGPGHKTVAIAEDRQMMAAMHQQIPDLNVVVDDIIAEGDRVVCRNTWRGTQASSAKKIIFTGIVIWRFENNKIVERWASVQPISADV